MFDWNGALDALLGAIVGGIPSFISLAAHRRDVRRQAFERQAAEAKLLRDKAEAEEREKEMRLQAVEQAQRIVATELASMREALAGAHVLTRGGPEP